MKTTKKIVALFLAILMAFSMISVSLTAVAASKKKVTKISLSKTKVTLYTNEKLTLKAKITPSNASNKKVKWSTSSSKIATVSSKGVVTPKKAGKVTITCAATDGSKKKATCAVTVKKFVKVTAVKLNATSKSIYVGKTYTLKATVSPSGATNKTVKWTSSNTKVATVSTKGVVKGVKAGTATITCAATDGSGKKTTCKVTIKNLPVSSITLSKTSITVYPTKSYTLTATVSPSDATNKAVKWTSSDTTAATVSSTGVVKGIKAGKTATITCTAADGSGKKATCKVAVGVITKGISLTASSATGSDFDWYVGKTGKLTANFTPENTTNKKVTWTSSEPECVTVDSSGNVKVVKSTKTVQEKNWLGRLVNKTVDVTKAVITATAADGSGIKATYEVNIKAKKDVTSVSFPESAPNAMFVGQTISLKAAVNPKDASERGIKYTTSNKAVATVDANGNVTALKAGEVTITATSTYKSTVTVSKKITVEDIEMDFFRYPEKAYYSVGDSISIYCSTMPPEALAIIGWHVEIEDEKVAVVTSGIQNRANLKLVGAGKTRIRAVSANGAIASDWVSIEVRELCTSKDYFEEASGGDIIDLEVYLNNGAKVAEGDPKSDIDVFLAPYGDYFDVDETGGYGKYKVTVRQALPATGAYITFSALDGNLKKKVYFSPNKYNLPSGTKAELLGKFKTYSAGAKNLSYADCTKTINYSDTVVDKKNSNTDLSFTYKDLLGFNQSLPLSGFINLLDTLGVGISDSEADEAEGLLDEMSPERMVNDLFTGEQTETATITGQTYPEIISVDVGDVKEIKVIDNGSSTYQIKLSLNDMKEAKALNLISSSAYGKTMKVIDEAYMKDYGDSLDFTNAGSFEGFEVRTSLSYKAINQKYSGGYVLFTIDKLNDKVVESEYHYKSNLSIDNAKFNLSAMVPEEDFSLPGVSDLTLNIKLTANFTMNVDSVTRYTAIDY